ncbi:MAG: hypothetical protein L0229_08020, partial [Blastocatellia bacterium]|nr:hypothetical protein [Blastocatellia bacterium]
MYSTFIMILAVAIAAPIVSGAPLSVIQTKKTTHHQAGSPPEEKSLPSEGKSLPSEKANGSSVAVEFERLRKDGNDAVYNLDYKDAREMFLRMTKIAPDHPAGYVYLANNLWLETLNESRRLTASLYSSGSFYAQDRDSDETDLKRERQFNDLIRQALAISEARLKKNPRDAEALYYQGSAHGLRAGYSVTVKRSFRKAIGDANASIKIQKRVLKIDPNYTDAYLSIGLYEYVIDSLPWFWKMLARVAGLSGSKKRGLQYLETVAEKGKYASDDARVLLIGLYSRENQAERALEIIGHLANKYPRNFLFGVERGAMLYRLGRHEEGDRVFARLLKDPAIAREAVDIVNYQWGEAMTGAGKFADAIAKYNAVKEWPKSSQELVSLSHLHAGQALDVLGKRDEAVAEYRVVLKR